MICNIDKISRSCERSGKDYECGGIRDIANAIPRGPVTEMISGCERERERERERGKEGSSDEDQGRGDRGKNEKFHFKARRYDEAVPVN